MRGTRVKEREGRVSGAPDPVKWPGLPSSGSTVPRLTEGALEVDASSQYMSERGGFWWRVTASGLVQACDDPRLLGYELWP